MHYIKNNLFKIILGITSVVFFSTYLFLYIGLPAGKVVGSDNNITPPFLILNQPDEVVNYAFIRQLVLEGEVSIAEPLSDIASNQVHPRSTTVIRGSLAPIGFPGFIVLASSFVIIFIKIFGVVSFNIFALAFTPLLASLTPLFFYGFLKKVWGERIAFVAALLLFFLPPWWYSASRPFQQNISFVFCLVTSLFFLSQSLQKQKYASLAVAAGSLFAFLSLFIRPAEVLWVSLLFFLSFYYTRKQWTKSQIIIALSIGFVIAAFFFVTQNWFYGSPFGTGYVKPTAAGESGSIFTGPVSSSFLQAFVAPFGVHPIIMAKNGYFYLLKLFSPWSILFLLGLIWNFFQEKKQQVKGVTPTKIYLRIYCIISAFLLISYGSWGFFDNLAGLPAIGSSHVRYFLPIYLGALPFVAIILNSFLAANGRLVKIMGILILIVLLGRSIQSTYFSFEGLAQVKDTIKTYYVWQEKIYDLVPENGIVVTTYGDKYIYPGRKVIPGLDDPERFTAIQSLLRANYAVYWYDPVPNKDVLEKQLVDHKLVLLPPVATWKNLELRRIVDAEHPPLKN